MPKLNTTQTRIATPGKPQVIVIGEGFGDQEATNYIYQHTLYQATASSFFLLPNSFKNKALIAMGQIYNYFSYDKSKRLIIGPPMEDI